MATPITIPLEQLKKTIRERLNARGSAGIRGLSRAFRNMDDDHNNHLDRAEFSKALTEMGLNLNKMEFNEAMRHFDANGDGKISFNEFLFAIRGNLNDKRKELVKRAFKKLDKDGNEVLTVADLVGIYNAKDHPKVLSGELTEKDVLEELLATFEGNHLDEEQEGIGDKKVTFEEFCQHYSAISSSIDDDEYFEQMMKGVWKLD